MHQDLDPMTGFVQRQTAFIQETNGKLLQWYHEQSFKKRVLLITAAVLGLVVSVIALIFHKHLLEVLVKVSDTVENVPGGWAILFVLIFFVGFPPLLGFSTLAMLCGMTYGFPGGWPLLASASITGSFASFMTFRYLLRNQAEQMVQKHEKFRAFAEILKEDASLFLLVLIRLCPLPYSLSNGALAAIPNLLAWTYLSASLITSPKMFVHVFIGHTVKNLGNEERPVSAKVLDVVSILTTGCAFSLATLVIYKRMQAKLNTYHSESYHGAGYDDLVFGNFDDEDPNLELHSTSYDDDHFIIEDEPSR